MSSTLELYWRQVLPDRGTPSDLWPPDATPGGDSPAFDAPEPDADLAAVFGAEPMVDAAVRRHVLLRDHPDFAAALFAAGQRVELRAGQRLVDFHRPGEPLGEDEGAAWLLLEGEAKLVYRRADPRVPELHLEDVTAPPQTLVAGRLVAGTWIGLPQVAWTLLQGAEPAHTDTLAARLAQVTATIDGLRRRRGDTADPDELDRIASGIDRGLTALRQMREEEVRTHPLPTDFAVEVMPRLGHPDGRAAVALRLPLAKMADLARRFWGFDKLIRHVVAHTCGDDPALARAMDDNPILRFLDPGRRHLLLQLAVSRRIRQGFEPGAATRPWMAAGQRPGRVDLLVRGQGQCFLPVGGGRKGKARDVLVADLGPGELVGHEHLFRPEELVGDAPPLGPADEPPRHTDVYLESGTELLELDWLSLRWLIAGQPATRAAALQWYKVGGDDQARQPPRVVAVVADGPGLGLTTFAVGAAMATASQALAKGVVMDLQAMEQRSSADRHIVLVDLQGEENWLRRWAPRGYQRVEARLPGGTDRARAWCLAAEDPDLPLANPLHFVSICWPEHLDRASEVLERLRVLPNVQMILVSGFEGGHGKMAEISGMLIGNGITVIWLTDDPVATYRHTPEQPETLIRVDRVDATYRRKAAHLAQEVERRWEQADDTGAARPAAADAQIRLLDDGAGADLAMAGRFTELLASPDRHPLARALHRVARALLGRSVGVALGGGGMWGAAQIALLRELELAGVPIDYVAGTSFGSVVGGLYAGGGLAALDLLLEHSCPDLPQGGVRAVIRTVRESAFFRATTMGAGLSTRPIQDELDRLLCLALNRTEPLPLACTEIPFMPVSTNLDTCAPFTTMTGTVGFGVRASSGLPPALPGLWRHGQRILDGALVANVPAEIVRLHGAAYVISANVVAPRSEPAGRRRLLSTAYDLTVRRFSDLQRGIFLLGWKAGDDQGRLRADYRVDLWTHGAGMMAWWQGQQIVRRTQETLFREQLGWSIRQHWERRTGSEGTAYRRVRADIAVQVDDEARVEDDAPIKSGPSRGAGGPEGAR